MDGISLFPKSSETHCREVSEDGVISLAPAEGNKWVNNSGRPELRKAHSLTYQRSLEGSSNGFGRLPT